MWEVVAAVERQFDVAFVVDYGADACGLALNHGSCGGDFDSLGDAADLQVEGESDDLRSLQRYAVLALRSEALLFDADVISPRLERRDIEEPLIVGLGQSLGIGGWIGDGDFGAGNASAGSIDDGA